MKQVKIKLPLRALTLASGLLLTVSSFAQSNAIKGHVKDASGELQVYRHSSRNQHEGSHRFRTETWREEVKR